MTELSHPALARRHTHAFRPPRRRRVAAATLLAVTMALSLLAGHASADVSERGTFTSAVAIEVPAFRGIEPSISLGYDSSAGNGLVGVGWRLQAGSYITRAGAHGGTPTFDDAKDTFLLDGEELVRCAPTCAPGGTHETRERDFARIRFDKDTGAWTRWRPDGVRLEYEPLALANAKGTYRWALDQVVDTHGQVVDYAYDCATAEECYLSLISYADPVVACDPDDVECPSEGARIKFHYELRDDPVSSATGDSLAVTTKRLRSIEVKMGGRLVRAYALAYDSSRSTAASLLRSVQEFPSDADVTALGAVSVKPGGTPPQPVTSFSVPAMTGAEPAWTATKNLVAADQLSAGPAATGSAVHPPVFDNATVQIPSGTVDDPLAGEETRLPYGSATGDFDRDGRTDFAAWGLDHGCEQINFSTVLASAPMEPAPDGSSSQQKATKSTSQPLLDPQGNPWSYKGYPWLCEAHTVQIGDFNADHRDDIVLRTPSDTLTVAYSRGDGEFTVELADPAPIPSLRQCATGDLDEHDGDELACVYDRSGSTQLGVVRFTDGGSAHLTETSLAGQGISKAGRVELAIGDADANADDEVLLAARTVTSTKATAFHWRLLVGATDDAGGVASWQVRLPGWTDPGYDADKSAGAWSLKKGDVDGDGRADVLLLSHDTGLVRISTSPKNGHPAASSQLTVPSGALVVGDVNGDGIDDLTVQGSGGIYHVHASGGGKFSQPDLVDGPDAPCFEGYQPADVDGNGRLDWLCATNTNAGATIGDEPFRLREYIAPDEQPDRYRWLAADVDGDGRQELAYVHPLHPGFEVSVLQPQPSGGYERLAPQPIENAQVLDQIDTNPTGWMAMDVGGPGKRADGWDDFVLVDRNAIYTLLAQPGGWRAERHPLPWWSSDLQRWTPTEIDRDGRADLVQFVSLGTGVRLEYLRSNGDGSWTPNHRDHFDKPDDGIPALVATHAPRFLATDVNGDRLVDYTFVEPGPKTRLRTLLTTGDGTWEERSVELPHSTTRAQARAMQPIDFNGDGLDDVALVRPVSHCLQVSAFVSTGTGWTHEDAPIPAAPGCDARYGVSDTNNIRLLDLNGDGLTDVLHLSHIKTDAGESVTAAHLLINRPGGPWTVIDKTLALPFFDAWAYFALDVDHDGHAELVHAGDDLNAIGWSKRSDLLSEVANGRGATTTVEYEPLDGSRAYLPAGSLPTVVESITVTDHAHNPPVTDATTWKYDGATWSNQRHSLLGFASIATRSGETIQDAAYELSDACGARVRGSATKTSGGAILARTVTLFKPVGTTAPFTCLPRELQTHTCEGKPQCKVKTTELTHDEHGNVTQRFERGAAAGVRRTVIDYRANPEDHILDRPARTRTYGTKTITTSPKDEDWRLAAMTEYVYDGNTTWDAKPGKHGDLREERAWDDHENRFAITTHEYDKRGNRTETTDPVGVTQSIVYDKAFELFPEHFCDPVACTRQLWDARMGVVTETTDGNGETTRHGHDAFGRQTSTVKPGGGTTRVRYLDEGTWSGPPDQRRRVRTEIMDGSDGAGVLWKEQLLDGLDRVYMTIKEGVGADIVSEVEFADASDRPSATSSPHPAGSPAVWTRHEYDAADRPTTTTLADGSTAETEYLAPGRTLTRDPVGREQVRYADEFGRIIRVEEHADPPQDLTTTRYEYNALDLPKLVVDDLGHETSTTYDSLGRRITEDAPDRGPRSWTWRADGTPETATDAREQTIKWDYDGAGRAIARHERDAAGKDLRSVSWTWDRDPKTGVAHGHSIGRIVRSEHSSPVVTGSTDLWYDVDGRAERSRTCIDGECADMRFTFDIAGRLDILEYPDPVAERVKHAYDDAGELQLLRKESSHVYAELGHNARGQLDLLKHRNGLVERFTYDPDRHWLDHHTIGLDSTSATPVFDAGYEHYRDAKLRLATERNPDPVVQRYFYDRLGRLVTVSSPDPDRRRDYGYDSIGRMTSTSTAGTYHYDDPDQIHAPTSTDSGHTRAYDANGNLTSLHDPTTRDPGAPNPTADWNLSMQWTVAGLPETIAVNAGSSSEDHVEIGYDADDQRVYKSDKGGATRYFNQYLEQRPDGGFTKLYWAGDRLVAKRDDNGLTSVHQDRKGSTRLLTDGSAHAVQRFDYDPYGKPLSTLHGDERLWSGKQRDHDTGLVHMNARSYDYELGHFVSADSIVPDLHRPQSLNRYAYTEGDPINYTDPSGHMRMHVDLRKAQYQESRLPFMTPRTHDAACGPAFAQKSCVRAAPGRFLEEKTGGIRWTYKDGWVMEQDATTRLFTGGLEEDGSWAGPQGAETTLHGTAIARRTGAPKPAGAEVAVHHTKVAGDTAKADPTPAIESSAQTRCSGCTGTAKAGVFGIGLGADAMLLVGAEFSIYWVWDRSGAAGLLITPGGRAGIDVGWSAGLVGFVNFEATSITQMRGGGVSAGIDLPGGGLSYQGALTGDSKDPAHHGVGGGVGPGAQLGVYGGVNYSWLIELLPAHSVNMFVPNPSWWERGYRERLPIESKL